MFGILRKNILAPSAPLSRLPSSPPSRLPSRRFATSAAAHNEDDLISLSILLPHKPLFSDKRVRYVSIPGSAGYYTVMKRSQPSVTEMRPGLITVNEDNVRKEKFFVSGGFTFVNNDNTCVINAVEAVPLEQIDPEAAQQSLTRFTDEANRATDAETKAKALIGVEVYRSMCWALATR